MAAGINFNQSMGVWIGVGTKPAKIVPSGGILNPQHVFNIEKDDLEIIKMVISFLNVMR